jgi:uncharacterized membrane protein YeaQ/YmgE (transglycosylase-associated protein family)
MSIIAWIVLGLIAGFIGSKIVNKSGEGVFLDIILGIVGAVVGGWLFSAFGMSRVTGLNIYSLLVAVVGAVVVLFVYHALTGRRTRIWAASADAALTRVAGNFLCGFEVMHMRKLLLFVVALTMSSLSLAQVGTTASEGAKATAEKAKQYGDQAKAAVSSEPDKSADKAKAQEHKAKAHHHAKAAKEAAKNIPK